MHAIYNNLIYIYYSMGGSVIWLDITRVGDKVFSRAAGE